MVALALGAALLLAGPVAPYLVAPRLEVAAGDAEVLAATYLEGRGLAVEGWRRATILVSRTSSNETLYLLRHMGTRAARALLEQEAPPFLWQVRFFRSAVEETAFVWVDEAGQVRGFRHILPEAALAPSLEEGEALGLAAAVFAAQVPGSAEWQRAGGGSEEREARRDFRFVWERPLSAPGAFLRALVEVSGEAVGGLRVFVRAPEEFLRERAARGPLALVWGLARGGIVAALAALAVALFARRYRRGILSLGEATLAGLAFSGLGLVALLADLPAMFSAYPTTMSLGEYLLWQAAATLQGSVLEFARGGLVVGLALSLWRSDVSLGAQPKTRRGAPTWASHPLGGHAGPPLQRDQAWSSAGLLNASPAPGGEGTKPRSRGEDGWSRVTRCLLLMLIAALLMPLFQVAPAGLREALGPEALAPLASWTGAAGDGLPVAAAATAAARQALELTALGVIGAALLRSRRRLWPLALVGVALLLSPEVRDGLDLAQGIVVAATAVAGAVAGARWLGPYPAGYVAVLFGALLLDAAAVLLVQPHVWYQLQGTAAAGLALTSAATWPLVGARASRPPGVVPAM